ncbi:MAG: type II toxin-antitoxin system HicB family antitoxin [Chloroflexi bacterium]|nr:type II toxin-antitoxin system HicB family antitoxin [Chloroflexota bacterium]
MKLYKLSLVIHQPSDATEDRYMAEVPALPGCRAWGDTPTEVMENLQSVAAGFIASYRDRGDPLPAEVEAMSMEANDIEVPSEFTVAV